MPKKKPEKVYQFHISLKHTKPKIWRRFLVTEDATLEKLHKIIQEVMGWEDYHLHSFEIGGVEYGIFNEEWENDFEDEKKVKLADLKLAEKQKFEYVYDFGDNWEHEIKVEKIFPFDSAVKYPKCLDGKLACPPEDCGSIWGYEELRELKTLPKEKLTEWNVEQLEWLGDYDFEYFSVDEINSVLWKRFAK